VSAEGEEPTVPKTLLVPLDGSPEAERALPVAERLATRLGADVVLVAAQLDGDEPTSRMDVARGRAKIPNARVEVVRSVSVSAALVSVAADASDAAICMATHARGRLGHALAGSVAEGVVRTSELPTVLVGPKCADEPTLDGPVLVAVDGSDRSNAIVPVASAWALALGTTAVLVHVFHPLDVETATSPEAVLHDALSRFADELEVETRVVRGHDAAAAIVDVARECRPALVCVATHGRSGLARVTLGSVATGVLRRSAWPVLVTQARDLQPDVE
jgi:nucleotide-binding universal stress UspA family protein